MKSPLALLVRSNFRGSSSATREHVQDCHLDWANGEHSCLWHISKVKLKNTEANTADQQTDHPSGKSEFQTSSEGTWRQHATCAHNRTWIWIQPDGRNACWFNHTESPLTSPIQCSKIANRATTYLDVFSMCIYLYVRIYLCTSTVAFCRLFHVEKTRRKEFLDSAITKCIAYL